MKTKTVRAARISPKIEAVSTKYKVQSGDIVVYVWVHDGYIEIVDEDLDKKSYVFAGKDTPQKRALWLKVLKVIETAIRQVPGKDK
jgi:hypothetical protein